jgi:hypothetical protein
MSHFIACLGRSTSLLPADLRLWMGRALDSGWFEIGPGDYDGGPGGTVCPIAAAAKLAGAWQDGGIAPGWDSWGTPEQPSELVEDFAAYFDLVAEDRGIDYAVAVTRSCLGDQTAEMMAA